MPASLICRLCGEKVMSIPLVRPYIFLRCKKCNKKTTHVMIDIKADIKKPEKQEIFECQECGETKKIFELSSV